MDYIVLMLLAFMTEEMVLFSFYSHFHPFFILYCWAFFHLKIPRAQAFWTLCGTIERILPKDFYNPPPQVFSGMVSHLTISWLTPFFPSR